MSVHSSVDDAVLTLPAAAALVKVHPKTLQNQAQRGRVPAAFKVGNQWRFNRDLLLRPPPDAPVMKRRRGRPRKAA